MLSNSEYSFKKLLDSIKKKVGSWRVKLGVWDQQVQTTIYTIDKQQGPTVQHKEPYSVSCNKP